jgi:hypothetical protein
MMEDTGSSGVIGYDIKLLLAEGNLMKIASFIND